MMNNFEKWRDSLTVEKVAEWLKGDFVKDLAVMVCSVCPLSPYCNVDAGEDCAEEMSKWANKECEE